MASAFDKKIKFFDINANGEPILGKNGRQVFTEKTVAEWIPFLMVEIKQSIDKNTAARKGGK